ncbi:hypothetical protein Y032_0015g2619 [Ancylostoma ceylanicum]|nr:hypothetical protein Y032_0015g2619 [Ancylostoma ceylanicum]
MIRITSLILYASVVGGQYMGYGPMAMGGYPMNPMMVNPFGMASPYGISPMYDAYNMMAYDNCIGMNGLGMGMPYGGYGMYGMNGMMNGMNGMNGMSGMTGMNNMNGMSGMNSMQSVGTLNNGNTMRTSMNRISGSRTRYGSLNQGCNGGCNTGGWLDAKKLKKA